MSQIYKAFFGVLAVSATFGAVQLASGHDLSGFRQLTAAAPVTNDVNRTGKSDRGIVKVAQDETSTITIHAAGLNDSSVIVRVPVAKELARKTPSQIKPASTKPGTRTVACEPPVSVLTEVAKLLQPGRCVT